MKKILYLYLTSLFCFNCYSQIIFEKGMFIDNSGQETVCFIKNFDWKNNPSEILYKLTESSEEKNVSIKNIKEFSINNISKYIRFNVKIDKSSNNIKNLSTVKEPIFSDEELLLKVLVEGKGNLFLYEETGVIRYFYKMENSEIQQLIYKSYLVKGGDIENIIVENNGYKQQLLNDLKCPELPNNTIKTIKYEKNPLVKLFNKYNECNNSKSINFEQKEKKDLFNLTIRPRFNSSSLALQYTGTLYPDINFENKIGFGIGLEAEYIFPYNKNKWAVVIEPSYQNIKYENKTAANNVSGGILISKVDYSSIEIPISLRHYFFLNKSSKIFINASYIFDFISNSSIEFTRKDGSNLNSLKIETINNVAFGIGYNYNKKYSLEFRYAPSREIIPDNPNWTSKYNSLSFILGYTVF